MISRHLPMVSRPKLPKELRSFSSCQHHWYSWTSLDVS